MKHWFLFSCAVLIFWGCQPVQQSSKTSLNPFNYSIQKKATAANGMVVSAHPLASTVGLQVMQQGGNAFDAVIATQLALAVVYSNAGNLGGGGFMVAQQANGNIMSLDYREMAPASAHRDLYLNEKGEVQADKAMNGHLSSGVPGTVAGLFQTLPYAKLRFEKLIQPAIDLAEKGFAISAAEARSLNNIQADLRKYNTVMPVFVKTTAWKEGDTLIQTELAQTLKRIQKEGAAGFYEGETAKLIVEEMKRGGGIITEKDLKAYRAIWRTPHTFMYKNYKVVSMPPPSSGGILLHQMLKMVEDKPLSSWGYLEPQSVQVMVEAERRAYADRAQYIGDPDFYTVPTATITSNAYLQNRMKDFVPGVAGSSQNISWGQLKESEETTHISIIDAQGNAVAVTTTLNNSYGSKTVVGGAGFLMNDEMDDFSAKPGVPNMYGAIGGEANAIAPGKRMLSSMTPTLVLQNNKPFLVIGTPGGTTIPTSVFQTIVNVIDFSMSTEDAVNKPKFHHQWQPDLVDVERTFPQSTREALQKMGYKLRERGAIGRTELIKVLPDGRFEGIADSRGDDSAAGY